MMKIILGMIFIIFVLMMGSFFAIHTYSAYDQRVNVTAGYEDVYNVTRNVTGYGAYNLSMLGYIIGILSLVIAPLIVLVYVLRR